MNNTLFHSLQQARRRLLQEDVIKRVGLQYINDTADAPVPCPIGMFYSSNGTYEKLPQHALVGMDCYGMSCVEGYSLFHNECVPHTIPLDLVWVCVTVICCLVFLVSGVLCALHMGRRTAECPTNIVLPESCEGSTSASQNSQQPLEATDNGFKNIVMGSYIDDYSRTFLDDDCSAMPVEPIGSYLDAKR
jgi:hypothetical protein